ncbi:acetolactate synthase [Stratiformator vulcanicus]|uniref:ACT domain-containing protein n=1 Tax=Stratiformator vulcanicus TaxID=2527980 RepID=A0A517R3X7_9PLAN|nr:acetolactate synthase [Stratiformator vulcanicus]QDT38543.1 hypothetical protein Pan189_29370 [Stratiformator vulcanicus]
MSSDYGAMTPTETETARGRPWACLRQFSVFMENRVGNLTDLMRQIERDDLKVVGLSILDSVDFAVTRMIMDNYERAHEIFALTGLTVFENDVIGIVLPDDPQPFTEICRPLLRAEVNIHYAYPLMHRRRGQGSVALYVDDLDLALTALEPTDLTVVTEQDLAEGDEFL